MPHESISCTLRKYKLYSTEVYSVPGAAFSSSHSVGVDVHPAPLLLRGIVEDGETRAHEEATIVEPHLVVATDRLPSSTVEAVEEAGCVATFHKVGCRAQVDDVCFAL